MCARRVAGNFGTARWYPALDLPKPSFQASRTSGHNTELSPNGDLVWLVVARCKRISRKGLSWPENRRSLGRDHYTVIHGGSRTRLTEFAVQSSARCALPRLHHSGAFLGIGIFCTRSILARSSFADRPYYLQ